MIIDSGEILKNMLDSDAVKKNMHDALDEYFPGSVKEICKYTLTICIYIVYH